MSWIALAAAAAPYIIGALQKKPNQPDGPKKVKLPDRSAYIEEILRQGRTQDSGVYARASEQAQDQVNRALARQGLTGSSMGAIASIEGQNRIAQAMIENQLERQRAAIGVANAYDAARAGVDQHNSSAAYDAAMASYNAQLARQAGVAQGVGNVANAAANSYAYDQYRNDQMSRGMRVQPPAAVYNPQPIQYQPTVGVPYYSSAGVRTG